MPLDPLNDTERVCLWWLWSLGLLVWWVVVALWLVHGSGH